MGVDAELLLSPRWITRTLAAAEAVGANVARVRLELGLESLDENVLVSRDLYLDVWERLVASTDRALPLRAGQKAKMEPSDVLAGVCATVPNLGEAIHTLARYVGAWTRAVRVDVSIDGAGATWVRMSRVRPTRRPGAAYADEFMVSDLIHGASWVTGRPLVPVGVWFTHARGAPLAAYRTALGVSPSFGGTTCAFAFDRQACLAPLLRHDPWVRSFARASVERVVEERTRMQPAERLTDRVHELLLRSFGHSLPTAAQVARRLGSSERTLRRRLKEEGRSFTDVLDAARREEALRGLREGESVSEVAARLGFSQLSSLHRACVRWTGLSPSAFRARTARHADRSADT